MNGMGGMMGGAGAAGGGGAGAAGGMMGINLPVAQQAPVYTFGINAGSPSGGGVAQPVSIQTPAWNPGGKTATQSLANAGGGTSPSSMTEQIKSLVELTKELSNDTDFMDAIKRFQGLTGGQSPTAAGGAWLPLTQDVSPTSSLGAYGGNP